MSILSQASFKHNSGSVYWALICVQCNLKSIVASGASMAQRASHARRLGRVLTAGDQSVFRGEQKPAKVKSLPLPPSCSNYPLCVSWTWTLTRWTWSKVNVGSAQFSGRREQKLGKVKSLPSTLPPVLTTPSAHQSAAKTSHLRFHFKGIFDSLLFQCRP